MDLRGQIGLLPIYIQLTFNRAQAKGLGLKMKLLYNQYGSNKISRETACSMPLRCESLNSGCGLVVLYDIQDTCKTAQIESSIMKLKLQSRYSN